MHSQQQPQILACFPQILPHYSPKSIHIRPQIQACLPQFMAHKTAAAPMFSGLQPAEMVLNR